MMIISGSAYMKIIPRKEYVISCQVSSKKLYVTHCWYQVILGWFSTWKITACGTLHRHELIHATNSITLPRRSIPTNDIGLMTAKYLETDNILYLSTAYNKWITYQLICKPTQNWTNINRMFGKMPSGDTLNHQPSTKRLLPNLK